MKLVVLCGGLSPEREVSLTSGSLVAGALVRNGHEVCLLDLYTGRAIDGGTAPAFSKAPVPPYRVSRRVPDLEALKRTTGYGDRRIGPGVMALCREADAVFIALHGDVGENGRLQAALDMEGIPYTGSGYIGSLLAMDKDISKQILAHAGLPTPRWLYVKVSDGVEQAAEAIEKEIGLPCVIKPCACGSSVGVSMPQTHDELIAAVKAVAVYEDTVLAECKIEGRELTVSVLGGRVLPAVEIIPLHGFYDYENKYQANMTREICPADLPPETAETLERLSLQAFASLRLGGYARFDFILDAGGTPWCLEANTLPGMTPTSLLPQAAAAVGIDYDELCERMIRMVTDKDPSSLHNT